MLVIRLVLSIEDESPSRKPVRIRSYVYRANSHNTAPGDRAGIQLDSAVMPVELAARAATAAFLYFDRLDIKMHRVQHTNLQRMPTSMMYVKEPRRISAFTLRSKSIRLPSDQVTLTLSDAGFGKYNNPCEEIIRELDDLHEQPNITLVSIGTARPEKVDTRRRRLMPIARKAVEGNGDPERVHQSIEGLGEKRIDYLRLNSPGGLDLDMDD